MAKMSTHPLNPKGIWKKWIPIKDYEELYHISNIGDVKSLSKFRNNGKGGYTQKELILKPSLVGNGYKKVVLTKEGNKEDLLIHRLVAIHFVPNPNNLPEVNHKDENILNNVFKNLEWCTSKENCNYGVRNNKISKNKSKKVYQYSLEGKLIKEHKSAKEASNKGFSRVGISNCCTGKNKTHKGFIWSFEKL